jgi:hypothetical protein
MKKQITRISILLISILMALSACQVATPTATAKTLPSVEPTAQPTALPVITSQNVAQLASAAQAAEAGVQNNVVWASDSSAFIAISNSGAVRYSADTLEKQQTFTFDNPAQLYAASPDGKTIAFSEDSTNILLADMDVTQNALTISSASMIGILIFRRTARRC